MPTSFVCWKWQQAGGDARYTAEHVNVLRRMLARHYAIPHRVICVTDDASGIDAAVEVVPLWRELADLPNPSGRRFPSCYRRLPMFADSARDLFGPRFVSIDLDCVVLGAITELLDRDEDFVAWRDPGYPKQYNGSIVMQTAGARRKVWDTFDAATSPAMAQRAGCRGSDQGWISYALGPDEATWARADGVYSFPIDLARGALPLPADAKMVFFHGRVKPWDAEAQRLQWVRDNYR